ADGGGVRQAAAAGPAQGGEVLEVVGPGVGVGGVVGGDAVVAQVDPQPAVATDAVATDAVAGAAGDGHAGAAVEGDGVAGHGVGGALDQDAGAVARRGGAAGAGANLVALQQVAAGAAADDVDAGAGVAGDEVAGPGLRAPHGVGGAADLHAGEVAELG